MDNQTYSKIRYEFSTSYTATTNDIDKKTIIEMHSDISPKVDYTALSQSTLSRLCGNIGKWVLAITVSTIPLGYIDPRSELRRSGASSLVWSIRKQSGIPISLAQARALALRILTETEKRLREERNAETKYLISLWENDN